ncbi:MULTISPECIES: PstS family phosphate ABC transporter substrate-binding protein [unclassified Marichromatium]|uniref:PstS family phosphate ABC transporter substrate-binding protein n=1 Tax=unclassified Marichromatium TaxID=2618417 RepID=UPI000F3D7ADE|nr:MULTISPECIES: PstS family phosphate ABC transporter substrate-binding protein [unclassified Marichromatium]MBO8087648.1 PstS family phosphate ABC transporter substrate-binding protein [Marichromatium sp.]RNE91078.1 PstS family phosphate ABC transporter substrate-binding protein [Marichromatium sp. AB31]RNE93714.1 PstS family phosphate ABC transporter substrate-binding protein [Marichromatium sp. AB32]
MNKTLVAAAVTLAAASLSSQAMARDSIYIVGSSTVFPFSTAVAETFGRNTDFATPKVESTGSGGGLKLFCAGVGVDHPDITNASRRMKASEFERCQEAGVEDITEVKIGYDGIALANSREAEQFDLSLRDIWLALAKDVPNEAGELIPNPYQTWNEVNPDLPEVAIEVLGPPPTSGTRDAFVELAMEGGCKTYDFIKAMKKEDKSKYKAVCHGIREDGAYVEAGENDNLIVQKLVANPDAIGIFGFSFLDQNADQVQGSKVDGVEPTFESIADGDYPVSRSLFFYVKNAHVGTIPGIEEFVAEFTGEQAWGPEGYLVDKGLIPLPDAMRAEVASAAQSFAPMSRP